MSELAAQQVVWKETPGGLFPFVGRRQMTWAPQEGSQKAALSCPIRETLYEGNRGPGKTDIMLMKFYQHCGKGYRHEWRGIIFRRTYPELQDIINKSLKWFTELCPAAKYNRSEHKWTFPDGETLIFAHFNDPDDYWGYHGHAYTFIGWEEICTWPTDECLRQMLSTVRSTIPGIPLTVFCTANPYGPGHNWVRARYKLPIVNLQNQNMVGSVIRDDEDGERVAIHGELRENKVLLFAQPDYVKQLRAAAKNEAQAKAWIYGDWNIVAGGMFDDLWDKDTQIVPSIPPEMIPKGWKIDRSFDWGNSKPFSVGWWAESNGEPFTFNGTIYGPVRGDLIRIAEWYGCGKKPNTGIRMEAADIALGIFRREEEWNINGRVRIGPADSSIFDAHEGEKSIAGEMYRAAKLSWTKADKRSGSRIQGWNLMRTKLRNAANIDAEGNPILVPREEPGIFFMDRCEDAIRTLPVLPRDDNNLDDVDTEAEDHVADEIRYRIYRKSTQIKSGRTK